MLRNITLCLFSALLLILAFPKTDIWFLTWIGLVPLMMALKGMTPRSAFKFGYLTGMVFFAGTLYWFINMSASAGIPYFLALLALVAIVLYLACYFGLFAVGYAFISSRSILCKIFFLPGLWALLEFTRDWLFTGFGWVNLGHSQYKNLPVIQIADMAGVFGISFVIVMVNVFLNELISFLRKRAGRQEILVSGGIVFAVLFGVIGYGLMTLSQTEMPNDDKTNISIIQPNIPQTRKWLPAEWPIILEELKELTFQAAENNPDLIIWPETSFPGFLGMDEDALNEIQDMARELRIPILFGAIRQEIEPDVSFFNTAVLLSNQGKLVSRYDKMHLVPFGEYIPLRRQFPFLGSLIPILDFSRGQKVVLFPGQGGASGSKKRPFAVLICFEDTIPRVTRRAVRSGARLLINITNDAWFLDSKEPFLHLQSAVFRSIENRRSLVRVANTGISCFIDAYGRINKYVQDLDGKKTFVRERAEAKVYFSSRETFYTKYGDIFVLFCLFCFLTGFIKK